MMVREGFRNLAAEGIAVADKQNARPAMAWVDTVDGFRGGFLELHVVMLQSQGGSREDRRFQDRIEIVLDRERNPLAGMS
jgi:hypothetical protein